MDNILLINGIKIFCSDIGFEVISGNRFNNYAWRFVRVTADTARVVFESSDSTCRELMSKGEKEVTLDYSYEGAIRHYSNCLLFVSSSVTGYNLPKYRGEILTQDFEW